MYRLYNPRGGMVVKNLKGVAKRYNHAMFSGTRPFFQSTTIIILVLWGLPESFAIHHWPLTSLLDTKLYI